MFSLSAVSYRSDVLSGWQDGNVFVWDIETESILQTLKGKSLLFHPVRV